MKGGHAATADTHRRHGGAAAALITLVEGAAGVHSVQLVQTGPDTLAVRLDTAPDHDHATVWKEVQARLQDHLCRHALESVGLIHDPPPRGATPTAANSGR